MANPTIDIDSMALNRRFSSVFMKIRCRCGIKEFGLKIARFSEKCRYTFVSVSRIEIPRLSSHDEPFLGQTTHTKKNNTEIHSMCNWTGQLDREPTIPSRLSDAASFVFFSLCVFFFYSVLQF